MSFNLHPDFIIKDEQELRSHFAATHAVALQKSQPRLDKHAIEYIVRSPFLCIGTQTLDGKSDVSPRGDPRGFVKVLDEKTIAIPDRPGNNRLDTQSNILANPSVGLLFMIPGFDDTLRINGKARITRDPEILKTMIVNEREPLMAIVVTIDELFMHCAKAFRRSKLWDPSQHQNRSEMPSLLKIIFDQASCAPDDPKEMSKIEAGLEEDYQKTMY